MNTLSPDGIVEQFLDRWRNSDLPAKMPEPMVVANGPVVELTLITVYELHQRQGHASRALEMLAALCDENGVFISLVARPMGGPEFSLAPCGPASLSTDELVAWYARHGFVETSAPGDGTRTMLRKPRTVGTDARLRERLEQMTQDLSVETYPDKLAILARDIPHTIRMLPSPGGEPLDRYNCVMYVLGLIGRMRDPVVGWHFRIGLRFLRWLIDNGLLQRAAEPRRGLIVTWSTPEGLKHVGILVSPDRAASKWSIGQLFEHGLIEVPTSYGLQLEFYNAPRQEIIELILHAIAEAEEG
jgi:hypothetical protein